MQQRNYLTNGSQETVMTLGKRIVNIYTGQKLGYTRTEYQGELLIGDLSENRLDPRWKLLYRG